MSSPEAKFIGQLLSTVGICLKAFKNQFTDEQKAQVVGALLEILFSPTAELVHLLTDAVLDVVLIMIDNGYVPFMQEQIPALMDKFFSILS